MSKDQKRGLGEISPNAKRIMSVFMCRDGEELAVVGQMRTHNAHTPCQPRWLALCRLVEAMADGSQVLRLRLMPVIKIPI